VKGRVEPDQYYVFETTLRRSGSSGQAIKPIIQKKMGSKLIKMVYAKPVKNVPVALKDRQKFVLNNDEILQLAKWSLLIEEHYQRSMDMEWAKDGRTGELFIVQARPETVQSQKNRNVLEKYKLRDKGNVLCIGRSVGEKIGQGEANIIRDVKEIAKFQKGQILVTEMTDPDWEPIMKSAAGIITNLGGRTCHAAIVSRELGIPCVVGTQQATTKLRNDEIVTVACRVTPRTATLVPEKRAELTTEGGLDVIANRARLCEVIARLKGSDALLCDVANGRITTKLLSRWGWEPHCPSWFHRHYIKRFYGVYPVRGRD
jgi:pyruvate,water dikinase